MDKPLRKLTGLVAALSIFMGMDVVADPVLITEKVNDSAPYGILETTPDAWWADPGETNWNQFNYTWSSYGNNYPAPPNPPWGAQKMLFTSSQTGALTQLKFDKSGDYTSNSSTRGVRIKVTNETTGANVTVTIDPQEHGAGNFLGGAPYATGTNSVGMSFYPYVSSDWPETPNAPFLIFKFNLPVNAGDVISMYPESDGQKFTQTYNQNGAVYIPEYNSGDNRFNKYYMWEAASHFLMPESYQKGVDVTYSQPDTTAPVITVTSGTDTVEQGSTWTDAGASADTGETVIASGTVDINTVGVYTITYTATDAAGNEGTTTRTVTVVDTTAPVITVTSGDSTVERAIGPPTVVSGGGRIWMDRNLGASQVATSTTDAAAYGDLFQWGRLADGHEDPNSNTTSTLGSSSNPGNSSFILTGSDWLETPDVNLWQGADGGVNNVCPPGFRLPTKAEWEIEIASWSSSDAAGALASPLKLTLAPYRSNYDGYLHSDNGSYGMYWSSTVSGNYTQRLRTTPNDAVVSVSHRGAGHSVRCIKDENIILGWTDPGATADGGETVIASGTVDINTVGTYTITYTATDAAGNEGTTTRTVTVVEPDTTAPVITVASGPVTVEQGSTWTDAGATADTGETVNASGTVDTSVAGPYTITYTATDAAGNTGTATRTVTVVDTTAPVITVTSGTDTVEAGSTWTDVGAIADTGETVTASGTVDASAAGTYTITYTASDAAGNVGTATRTVTVLPVEQTFVITVSSASSGNGNRYFVNGVEAPALQLDPGKTYVFDLSDTSTGNHPLAFNPEDVGWTLDITSVGTRLLVTVPENVSGMGAYYCTAHLGMGNLIAFGDMTAPVITVASGPVTVEQGSTWTDAGATADTGETVNASGTVDTSVAGPYTITYTATDAAGNTGTATRTVTVVDTTAPVISVTSGNDTVELESSWTDAGATADTGETVTTSGIVDTSVTGTYTITYTATDAAGNTGAETRTVTVVDTTIPVITLSGGEVTVEVGGTYTELGATFSDNYDTNLTVTINSSAVNTSVLGSYSVIYSATDSSLNQAVQVTRAVNVVDTTSPVITLIGDAVVTIEVAGTYTEPGATVSDNYDTGLSATIDSGAVNTSVVGSYSVTYTATDLSGNTGTATRTVIVSDTIPPAAPTLTGPSLTNSPSTLTLTGVAESGSTVRIYDGGNLLGSAGAESGTYSITVSSLPEGSHDITATATDEAGNVSDSTTLEVEVDTTAPVISVTPGADTVELGSANITVTAPMTIWTAGVPHAKISFNSSSTADQTALASALGFESFDQTAIINYMINNDIEMTVIHDNGNPFTFKISSIHVPSENQSFGEGYTGIYLDPRPVTSTLQGDFEITIDPSWTDAGATADSGETVTVVSSTLDTNTAGIYTVTYSATDAAGNVAQEVTRTVNVVDTTSPVITLNGDAVVTIEVGGSYTEFEATVSDNYHTGLSATIDSSAVNTSVFGSYSVTYNVTDSNSNVAQQVTRTVNVVDTTSPVITLNGDAVVTIEVGGSYTEFEATVSDNYDTGLSATIDSSAVNTSVLGSYSVTYNVTDSNSNVAQQVTRTVNVVDTTLPVIALNGGAVVTIPLGGSYTEQGATVSDNYDTELAVTIDSSAVNTSVVASYSVTYNVTDDSNNTGTATRTVNVVDQTLPVITLTGGNVTIEAGESYTELGATASDNYYTGLSVTPTGAVNTSAVGTYTITYSATDPSNNTGTATRTVTVVDTTAPVVTVTPGNDAVVMGASWTDAGATSDGVEAVTATGSVNTNTVGTYTITYSATDGSQNTGTATRTVIVRNSLDSFGDVVIYPNQSTTLIGQVTIEGEAAESGDVVAVYVGSELRGKQVVIIYDGNAWVNMLVNSAGGSETISFKVFDSSTGLTHEKSKASAVIGQAPFTLGNAGAPFMIAMNDFETQTLSLKEGWNLVSFYVEADDMSPQVVLAPIQNQLVQIKNVGYSYNPTVNFVFNTLTDLNVKDGYWLEVSEDVSFEVEGRVSSGVSTNLNGGWNLVGYPRMNGEAVASELTSLGSTVVQMKSLEKSYDPSNPSFLNTLSTMAPGLGYWLNVSGPGTWVMGDGGPSFANFKTRSNHSSEQKVGPVWSEPVVYPNLGATVLAKVSIQGKPVAMGSVVGVFVGNELRGQQNVVLHEGNSYVTLNVNLNEVEEVSYRVWNRDDNNEYLVSGTMLLELGVMYGSPELVELNAVEVVNKPLQVFNVTSEPFGFSFNTMAGWDYTVEATGDLRTWEAVESFQGSGGEIRFIPRPTSSGKRQFFRVYVK